MAQILSFSAYQGAVLSATHHVTSRVVNSHYVEAIEDSFFLPAHHISDVNCEKALQYLRDIMEEITFKL